MPNVHNRDNIIKRLRRIEGQVRGLTKMVEDERYCIDILTQVQAVKAALKKAEEEILKDHANHCIHEAIASGNANDQKQKFDELIGLMRKFS